MSPRRVRLSSDADSVAGYRQTLRAFGVRGADGRPVDEMSDYEVVQEAERLLERGLDLGAQAGQMLGELASSMRTGAASLGRDASALADQLQSLWRDLSGGQAAQSPPPAGDEPPEPAEDERPDPAEDERPDPAEEPGEQHDDGRDDDAPGEPDPPAR